MATQRDDRKNMREFVRESFNIARELGYGIEEPQFTIVMTSLGFSEEEMRQIAQSFEPGKDQPQPCW